MRSRSKHPLVVTVPAFVLALSLPGWARDREFSAAVHHIESTYHVHRSHRFLMWGVGMIVKVAHPEGVSSLRLAIFEDQKFSGAGDDMQFTSLLEKSLRQTSDEFGTEAWQRMVRVWSRHEGERTYIYARPRGNDLELFIVALETDEAVVLKLRMNPDKLDEFVNEHRCNHKCNPSSPKMSASTAADTSRGD